MSFVLILHFVLNGHVHTVNTGRTYSSQQECSGAGAQAKDHVVCDPVSDIHFLANEAKLAKTL
jgi:hypothetical protein